MTQTGTRWRWLRTALATLGGSIVSIDVAFASQGPGGGMGTASHRTQMLMALVVYGSMGLIVAAGLIRAARRSLRN